MKEEIILHLENPGLLEKMYRSNRSAFKKAFNSVFDEIREKSSARFWHERLNYESDEISWGTKTDLVFVVIASFIAGLIAKIPAFTHIDEQFFYPRNLSLVVFPFLTLYFLRMQKLAAGKLLTIAAAFILSAVYINLLPENNNDTTVLACIHLPLFLWSVLGFTFTGNELMSPNKRLEFLRYNGDLLVMTTIILIAGAILTGITIGLFSLIQLNIERFYFDYIAVWGVASAPIVGTYLVRTNPQLVNKVSPVIAKIFTPLVLVMLSVYLCAVIYTGKNPYTDREFLLIFNMLLIGVMAIILFSIAETTRNRTKAVNTFLLLALSMVTIIVNGIALSAIVFRISEWGFTPNRIAVLGSNLLFLINLLIVTYRLLKTIRNKADADEVERSITSFLPVYAVWVAFVTFFIPLIFGFS